ncbi:MarR family winged helix-turn-helix transcriptional regulator [Baekduia sp. Peel2402]|uniref:MarR family winged helix-turn-helix transcriptional regulator n=1 Tax=Baekduia sp. Peel2402 TaxID=3458296 RepID=UPI00403ECCDA
MPPAPDADDDVARLASDLRLTLGRLVRRARAESTLLPVGQTAVLGRLDREGPMTTSDLAAAEKVRPQSMARTVSLLQDEGFIAGEPHPTDGRKTLLRIAPAGLEKLVAQRDGREHWLAEALAGELTAAERKSLRKTVVLLDRLTER